jgi:LuxR family maltose regulon positive regulatory protein
VESLQDIGDADGETVARALLLEANLANQRGDPVRTIACAERALTLLPADSPRTRASAAVLLESAYLARGDLRAAERVFAETQPTADQLVIDWLLRSDRAVLDALRGHLHDAARMHRAILHEIGDLPVVYAVEQRYRLAVLHFEWNELDEAEQLADEALTRAERAHAAVFVPRIQLVRAQLAMARGDLSFASQCIELAEAAAERIGNAVQRGWALALRARWHVLRQDLAAAEAWAAGVRLAKDLYAIEHEPEALALARVELARGDTRLALVTLSHVLDRAEATGCEWSAVRALVGRAVALAASGYAERALAALDDALRRAEPGGFRRVFLDDASVLAPLLRRARSPLAASLLGSLERPAAAALVSAREQEVLVLVAQGLSNRDIAERLVVTPNTVKAHLRHLGTKLGTSSRTQLLARARQSGLLP